MQTLRGWVGGLKDYFGGKARYDVLILNRSELLRALELLDDTFDDNIKALELRVDVMRRLAETEDELRSYYGWTGEEKKKEA